MLDLELSSHAELSALLDLEWLVLERLLRSLLREINGDWRTALRVHGQGEDDADAGVVWIRDGLSAGAEAQRLLVTTKGLIALVYVQSVSEVLNGLCKHLMHVRVMSCARSRCE